MKHFSGKIHTILFALNIVLAFCTLFSYFAPCISPIRYPSFAVIGLAIPVLLIANIFFTIYWLIRLKKQFLLSCIIVILGANYIGSLFLISGKKTPIDEDIKIMSYNTKGFSHFGWAKRNETAQRVFDFINAQNPDILALQEYYVHPKVRLSYPYEYIKLKTPTNKFGQAIYSKYLIVNSGSLHFENSANDCIYIDILIDKDTVRVYNIHLESLKVNPNKEHFGQQNSEKLYQRIKKTFLKQAKQTHIFSIHKKMWKGKMIICGDLNNTAFSWVYNKISDAMSDAYMEAGSGFGKTYDYLFPLRIDFILTDKAARICQFKTFNVPYSDHFPIMTRVNWKVSSFR
ncbi:MAG: endonuclease [Flavobacteriaceae bacterium]|nr:MAG: endonuclease [Flavobacteriaceae bacterium]